MLELVTMYEMLSSAGRRKLHKILPASGGRVASLTEDAGLGLSKSLLIGVMTFHSDDTHFHSQC